MTALSEDQYVRLCSVRDGKAASSEIQTVPHEKSSQQKYCQKQLSSGVSEVESLNHHYSNSTKAVAALNKHCLSFVAFSFDYSTFTLASFR